MAKQPKVKKEAAAVPSVLAFNRKIEPSDALLQSGLWSKQDDSTAWQNIELHEKRNRATKSQYGVDDKEKIDPNLVWGDDARLPFDADTLKVLFTIKFLGNIAEPTTHNRPEFEQNLKAVFETYQSETGFLPLAKRYAQNLANARFLWRNRLGAEDIIVQIKNKEDNHIWTFDAYQFDLYNFDSTQDKQIDELAALIAKSFSEGSYLLLEVTTFAKLGEGQHVFPSQEMVMDPPKGQKSKFLYQVKTPHGLAAGIHSEKIGNAIRTIDTWYETIEILTKKPAIAVEPYGSVPTRGAAYRINKTDFYTLLTQWLAGEDINKDDQHFVVANLIRGGVFGGND
ncbi:type I-F CRISPR-associated protein Csy3 [uncultured Acinetobacter sp.]|uniref:type I-F CRISPR-associated protein Csy3 n=1 Tax=uncultured Acinetobacter sp. TaxID=165433 RepID=UPI002586C4F9|nr:type I-F CRISPR-associated protein Csy3 [uncultured Acinetobacter sp.]